MVQEWILQDNTTPDIITQSISNWQVSERQAYRYLWAANRFFIEKDKKSLDAKRAYYVARKRKLLRDMNPVEKKTAAGVAAINRVLDSMAKLDGVTVDTLKLIGDEDQPIVTKSETTFKAPIDYGALPIEFLDMVLANRRKSDV